MSYGCIFSVLSLILLFLPECGATKLAAGKLFHRRVHLRSSHYLGKNPNSCFASLNISFRQTRQVSRFSYAPGLRPTAHRNPLGSRWILRGTKSNDPPKSLLPQRNAGQVFQFFAIYIILPFLICTILNMTNDIYCICRIISTTNVKRYIWVVLIINLKLAFLTRWQFIGILPLYPN